ncbi:MAG: TonB-dependent receptor [Gemmatimonadales bacterium]
MVVIQTIRGQQGAPRINLSQRFGTFDLLRKYEPRCYTLDEAVTKFGQTANDYAVNGTLPCYNHYDQVFGDNRLSYETVADVSGGTDATRYFISGTWKRDEGIAQNTGFGRQALRINVDQKVNDKLDLKVSSAFNRSSTQRGFTNNANNFGSAGYALAYTPSYIDLRQRADGTFPRPAGNNVPAANPVQTNALALNDEEAYRFTGGATLNYRALATATNSLLLVMAGGTDIFEQKNRIYTPNDLFFEEPQNQPGTAVDGNGVSRNFNWNLNGIWTHAPAAGTWSSSFSAGAQYEDRRLRVGSITTTNLVPGQGNVNQGTNFAPTDSLGEERTFGVYANEELRLFDDRLTVQAGVRAERSSANGNTAKYYVFPRASAAYRLDLLGEGNELKVRAAYGETGNQPLFGQKFTLLNTPQIGGRNGFTIAGAAGAPDIQPERLKEVEAGFDASFGNGRLVLEGTYYRRVTDNLFLNRVPASSSGFANQIFNGGKIRNQGVEVLFGVTPIQTRGFQWVTRTNFALNRSLVLELPVASFRPPQSGFGGLGVTFIEEGKSLSQLVGFAFDEQGNRTATQVALGDTRPDFRVGFSNDVNLKSLNLSFTLDWQQGGSVINLTQFLYDDAGTASDFGSAAHAERIAAQAAGVMTPYIEDATFLKVREVSLGYQLPNSVAHALGIGARDARISLTGRNLFMWTKYSGLDPEVANFGSAAIRNNLDIAPFPPSRSVFLNIALGF